MYLKKKFIIIKIIIISFVFLGLIILNFGIDIKTRKIKNPLPEMKEIRYKYVHLRSFRSSENPEILLWALIHLPHNPSCILVTASGWHGSISMPEKSDYPKDYLLIEVAMRGRFFSNGKPDSSGWELQDWIDAVEFARKEYSEYISDPECVYADGGSGAGGNVYAIVGKFPDFFSAASVHAGMSDYMLLYNQDENNEFRDEMEGAGWIGGTPETNSEGYKSRGGLTTAGNLLTPIHIDHGETDIRVPVTHARRYVNAVKLGSKVKYLEWTRVGDRRHWTNVTKIKNDYLYESMNEWYLLHKKPPELPIKGKLTVAGYVKTKYFEILLEHIDRIGWVDYQLSEERAPKRFHINAPTCTKVILRVKRYGDKEMKFQTSIKKSDYKKIWIRNNSFLQIEFPMINKEVEIIFN